MTQITDPMLEAGDAPPGTGASPKSNITINNPDIQAMQKKVAALTIVVPAAMTALAIVLAFTGLAPSLTDIVVMVVLYISTCLGVTVGFHRLFSHRSFKATPPLKAGLAIFGCMAAQGTLVYWVATHRRHHQFSEGEGDPHSPYYIEGEKPSKLRGLWHSHLGWMLDSKMTNTVKFAKDLIRDPMIARINDRYYLWVVLGLVIPAAIGALAAMSWTGAVTGLLWGGFVRMFLVHHVMWTSGSTAHIFGSRPFLTRDKSTNNGILALPNLGEAWHNNHHAFPSSAIFGLHWWQVDPGAWFIKACVLVGLASDVRRPTQAMIDDKKAHPEGGGGIEVW